MQKQGDDAKANPLVHTFVHKYAQYKYAQYTQSNIKKILKKKKKKIYKKLKIKIKTIKKLTLIYTLTLLTQ